MKKIVIANWKMHGSTDFVQQWVSELSVNDQSIVVVCPPFPYITQLRQLLNTNLFIGGQDISSIGEDGARTSEISARMLADTGCTYTLIGHSEKRHFGGDTDALCAIKHTIAANANLKSVVCIGEQLEIRKKGQALSYVVEQIKNILHSIPKKSINKLHLAYEPLWAIGTGLTPSMDEIEQMHNAIREELMRQIGTISDTIPLLYGGSVKSTNSKAILNLSNVNGLLVGGASLLPLEFNKICNSE